MKLLRHMYHLSSELLRLEFRSKTALLTHALFLLVSIFIFSVALPRAVVPPEYSNAGVLWTTVFLSTSSLAAALFMRSPHHAWTDSVLLAGVSPTQIFMARSLTLYALMLILVAFALPMLMLFTQAQTSGPMAKLIGMILIGCASYATIASLFSSLMSRERFSELLLPILVFPVTLPILIVCVRASTDAFMGQAPSGFFFLLGYALVMLPASTLISEYVIEME